MNRSRYHRQDRSALSAGAEPELHDLRVVNDIHAMQQLEIEDLALSTKMQRSFDRSPGTVDEVVQRRDASVTIWTGWAFVSA